MMPLRRIQDVRATLTITCLIAWSFAAAAQTGTPAPGNQKPGMAPRPPLLFSEPWRLPPHTGEQTDENMRVTPAVVTNPRLEVKLYGPDASVVRAAVHEERIDLWNGMTLISRGGDPAGPAQLPRSGGPGPLAVDPADQCDSSLAPGREAGGRTGSWSAIAASRRMASSSPWRSRSPACAGTRLDPGKVIVLAEVFNPNLRMVDEVGLAMLAPGGGHGIAGSANLSTVELFAHPVPG